MEREPCYQCGEHTPLGARICSHCYSNLLVDVILDNPVSDDRLAYRAARAQDSRNNNFSICAPLKSKTTLGTAPRRLRFKTW